MQFACAFSNLVTAGDATGEGVEFEVVGRLSEALESQSGRFL